MGYISVFISGHLPYYSPPFYSLVLPITTTATQCLSAIALATADRDL
jgi:hypothetical protein